MYRQMEGNEKLVERKALVKILTSTIVTVSIHCISIGLTTPTPFPRTLTQLLLHSLNDSRIRQTLCTAVLSICEWTDDDSSYFTASAMP